MYLLSSDQYVPPAVLTGYVRKALWELEVNQFTLSQYLPSETINDLDYRFAKGGDGLVEAAVYRTYDAEAPIGSRKGIARTTGELPPISRKIPLMEYDRLKLRNLESDIKTALYRDAERLAQQVAARIEVARAQAILTGKVSINENGVVAEADFGRDSGCLVTAATLWSASSGATPLTDLMTWRDSYVTLSGGSEPGLMLMSRRIVSLLMRDASMRNLVFPGANQPSLVTESSVQQALTAFGLPPIRVHDGQVSVAGSAVRLIPNNKVVFLPAPGSLDAAQFGKTLWGVTLESQEPDYGLVGSEPGIVAGTYRTDDPIHLWTKVAGIAMPVVANPNLSMVATVAN